MEQLAQTCPRKSQHPEKQKNNKSLKQAIEEAFWKNGLEPKWDYSKAGQSVVMPTRKRIAGNNSIVILQAPCTPLWPYPHLPLRI